MVYGPSTDALKQEFLSEIRDIRLDCPGAWAIAGDFNLLLDPQDKNNDRINRSWIQCFRLVVNELALKDAPLIGRSFTWSNERVLPTLEKIDRWFGSVEWETPLPRQCSFC